MGSAWIAEECGKIVDGTGAFLGRANSDEDAKNLCSDHKSDCDAYEARIAELIKFCDERLCIGDMGMLIAIAEGRKNE